jgi:hypothetical protein
MNDWDDEIHETLTTFTYRDRDPILWTAGEGQRMLQLIAEVQRLSNHLEHHCTHTITRESLGASMTRKVDASVALGGKRPRSTQSSRLFHS